MTDTFSKIKDDLLTLDPVYWTEKHLTVEGSPYRLLENGYRPIIEIMRYIGIKSLEKNAKPMVWLKSRQIGGTISSSAACMYFMGSGLFGTEGRPPFRIAYVLPTLDRAMNFSKTKLQSFIDSSVLIDDPSGKKSKVPFMKNKIDKSSLTNDNVRFKQFDGGSHMWIESAGIDASRLRGLTCDMIVYDEIQDIPEAAISNGTKILNQSHYGPKGEGVQLYFGTPLQKGSAFWRMWNKSSQQYFHLGCEGCKKTFPLYTPGTNDWENVWIYGDIVRCVHCGREQNRMEAINRGKWIAVVDPQDAPFVGFHLNQLYMPGITKEQILAQKPGVSAINTERAFQNEVLGEFFQGEAGIISAEEIRERCGDPERPCRNIITPEDDMTVFMGIDIGAKGDLAQLANSDKVAQQGQSYSCATIISVKEGGKLSIEYAHKFKRNDLESKKQIVAELIKRFNVRLTVCDIGYANDFCEVMQTEWGEKFIPSQAGGKVNGHVKFNQDIFPKTIFFERDFYITEVYELLKKGLIRFPLKDYEKVSWLMQHCANMEIKPRISQSGDISPFYVKAGNTDGFMSLINAYLAYKFHISQGFNILNPLLQNKPDGKQKSTVIVVDMPRFGKK